MARVSLAQRVSEISNLLDRTRRHIDLAARLQFYERKGGRLIQRGSSRIFGGVWDCWARTYDKAQQPSNVVDIPIGADQWDALRHFVEVVNGRLIVCAGRGWGKSQNAAAIGVLLGLEIPQGQIQFVSPTYSLSQLLWDKILNDLPTIQWLHPTQGKQVAKRRIALRNGCVFRFGSADRDVSLRAGDADAVIVDERQDVRQSGVDIVTFQMRKRGGFRMLQIGTPLAGTDFEEEFGRFKARSEDDRRWSVYSGTSYDNPFIPHTVFEDARETMDPLRYRQEVLGEWVSASTRVYHQFEQRNIAPYSAKTAQDTIRRLYSAIAPGIGREITPRLLDERLGSRSGLLIGLDLELSPLTAVVCRAFRTPADVPDLLWVVDEVQLEAGDATSMARELRRLGHHPACIVPDAAGHYSEGGASSIVQLRAQAYDVRGPRKNPYYRDMINAINAKLFSANEHVSLLVDPRCRSLIKALREQRLSSTGQPMVMEGGADRLPRALGYVAHLLWPPRLRKAAA